jgi:phage terminase large subunit GpA-like protein
MTDYLQGYTATLTPPDYNLARWVESHRVLDRKSSAETGEKRISRTPYLRPLYDWFVNDKIKEIIIQKPAQIGITDWVVDCILWVAVNDPSPTALFLADQDTARKIMRFRLDPAFRALGLIKRKMAKNAQQEISKFEIQLTNGFYLAVSWGSSISQTASMSFKRVFTDEVCKPGYDVIKEEGDTLGRIRERMETFGDSKFVLLSTPTLDDGRITVEFNDADTRFDYCVPCHACGTMQALTFAGVVWGGGSKATREQIEESARYKCCSCSALWDDEQRRAAVALGVALPRESGASIEKVGYQLHRLSSLFKGGNLARMIYNFTRAQDDPQKLQNIVNSTFGEPWIPRISASQGDAQAQVAACRNGLAHLQLPEDTAALVAAIDVQMQGFWYCIRAVCSDGATHNIDHGYLNSWEEVDNIVFDRRIQGRKIWRCLIDTGGGKDEGAHISRTEEVYLWLRANAGRGVQIFGTKGSSRSMATKIRIGAPIEKTPSGKPIPGGLRIVQINTDALKDALWFKIERTNESPELPGNWWIHRDTEQGYLKQICAEEKRRDRKGGTSWHRTNKDNHYLDVETLILAAVDPEFWGGIRAVTRGNHRKPAAASQVGKPANMQRRPNPYTEGL